MEWTAVLGRLAGQVVTLGWRAFMAKRADTSGIEAGLEVGSDSTTDERQVKRLLDQARKRVQRTLQIAVDSDIQRGDLDEWIPVVDAVELTLRRAPMSTGQIVAQGLDRKQVQRGLSVARRDVLRSSGLGGAGGEMYDRLLAHSLDCLIAFVADLPSTKLEERRHNLTSLARLLAHAERAEAETRRRTAQSDERMTSFRATYARGLAKKFGMTQLYGVDDLNHENRSLELSLAWSGLRASSEAVSSRRRDGHKAGQDVGVDELLDRERLILLQAHAGYGKTTLLHRWTVMFSEPTSEIVPFYIPLRKLHSALPSVAGLLKATVPHLADSAPPFWIEQLLSDGNALVLVDGIDEVPRESRKAVVAWITELADLFPSTRIIVTSRPLDEALEGLRLFTRYLIEPMSLTEIKRFSDHWHRARSITDAEASGADPEFAARSNRFKMRVTGVDALKQLASCPLLCAIMCGMHHELGSAMPRDRMGLYEAMIKMLLWKREAERESGIEAEDLDYVKRVSLLRDISYWMLSNEYVVKDKDDVIDRVRRKSYSLGIDPKDAERTCRILLERTGVIQEESVGEISFIHRTFQEYLAAEEVMLDDRASDVVRMARDESMREFVVLAAGHANRAQRLTLLTSLLEPPRQDRQQRKRLRALAIACQETSPEIDSKTREQLRRATAELTPPRDYRQAADLIRAVGVEAVPLLQGWQAEDAKTVSSVVYGLSLLGTDAAMSTIATYAKDPRKAVVTEIVRAWRGFERHEYAAEVLGTVVLDKVSIALTPPQLRAIDTTDGTARHLQVIGRLRDFTDAPASAIARIGQLDIDLASEGGRSAQDALNHLARSLGPLDALTIRGESKLDLSALGHIRVERLTLDGLGSSWAGLPTFSSVTRLDVRKPVRHAVTQRAFPAVRELAAFGLSDLFVPEGSSIKVLRVEGGERRCRVDVSKLSTSLVELVAGRAELDCRDAIFTELRKLDLERCGFSRSSWGEQMPALRVLAVSRGPVLDLGTLPLNLVSLDIHNLEIRGAAGLERLARLRTAKGEGIRATRNEQVAVSRFAGRHQENEGLRVVSRVEYSSAPARPTPASESETPRPRVRVDIQFAR